MTEAILFDLDGTLLDTAPDLGGALNAVLINHGKEPLPMPLVRTYVSRGAMALVELGFGHGSNSTEAQPLWQELIDYCANHLADHTCFFDGILPLLDRIEKRGKKWGIVTNKPGFLTTPLLEMMALTDRAQTVVSGDTMVNKKPHPDPIWHACNALAIDPTDAVYIGDDRRDIEAGNSAGMPTLGALWGYILAEDDPSKWGANGLIHHPDAIDEWIT